MARHYPSGMFPADVAPATKDKPAGKPLSEHHDRLNAIGRYLSPDDRAAALRYLEKRGLDDVAQMLAVGVAGRGRDQPGGDRSGVPEDQRSARMTPKYLHPGKARR